ncbi:hypothetical protein AAW51_0566 [Caldimonas brevitalea]|uniref:DUF945 domain-containing protein n=2 Tax=Caldimonas brevitalea TaxID=413882 RepID=A0A0G3BD24_9BURK|nr:hypothetical protein AAW51_0566 [Caldimonas brevitalea]
MAVGLGAVAVAAAAYVGASAYVGQQVQQALQAQPEKLAQQLPFIKVAEHRYEKGLFSSTRTLTLQFGCEAPAGAAAAAGADGEAPTGPVTLTLRDHIRHGPLLGLSPGAAQIDTELELPADVKAKLAKVFGEQQPLSLRTLVAFDGRYTSQLSSPAVQIPGPNGEQLAWKGLQVSVSSDAEGSFLNYQASAPGFEVNDPAKGVKMVLSNVSMQGQGRPVGGNVWLMVGEDEGSIGSFEVTAQAPVQQASEGGAKPFSFKLENLKFTAKATVENDLLSSQMSMIGGGMIGATKLDKVEMAGSLKRLHAPTYQRLMSSMMKSSFPCDTPAGEAADPSAMLAAMQQDMVQLLPHNPEYSLDKLAVEYGGQRGEMSYSLGVQGVTEADLKLPAMALLMTKGRGKADIKLPVKWIEQIAGNAPMQQAAVQPEMVGAMLDQFAAQGFVVRDGDNVGASVRFENGELVLNGKPLPLGRPPAN